MKNLTKKAIETLKKERDYLKEVKRKEIIERLKEAKSFGDLSENFEYAQAKEDQASLERRIFEIESILRDAKVVDSISTSYISLGSRFQAHKDGQEIDFEIVSPQEADPANGKISDESPLGQAFLGKKPGNKIELKSLSGKIIRYEIIKIYPA